MAFEKDSPDRLSAAKRSYTLASTAMVLVAIHAILHVCQVDVIRPREAQGRSQAATRSGRRGPSAKDTPRQPVVSSGSMRASGRLRVPVIHTPREYGTSSWVLNVGDGVEAEPAPSVAGRGTGAHTFRGPVDGPRAPVSHSVHRYLAGTAGGGISGKLNRPSGWPSSTEGSGSRSRRDRGCPCRSRNRGRWAPV